MSYTILDVEKAIAAYLRQDVADFTQNGINLLRMATNKARKHAERLHDWEHTKGVASVTTSATGQFTVPDAVKQFQAFYLVNGDVDVPMRYATKQMGTVWAMERISKLPAGTSTRYPADYDVSVYSSVGYTGEVPTYAHEVFLQGRSAELYPATSVARTVKVAGYMWMDDYASDTDEDFFTLHGFDFLLWAGVVEVNNFNFRFTDNTENVLSPPVRMRDEALAALVEHDNFQVDGYRLLRR